MKMPQVVAFPLKMAGEELARSGFKVRIIKTLPPGTKDDSDVDYRVARQRLIDDKLVELVITMDTGKRG
ncbi:MAG: hypothetical protein GX887_09120 [Firmicutes bacterium]|nr:hypothetical protein [Bacillota bacterium]